jgi:hypothetical protein
MNVFGRAVAIAVTPAAILAQSTNQTVFHTVTGVAYDSIARRPLAGAVVEAVGIDDIHAHTFTAISDGAGRFRLTGLPDGRFAVGFQHDALNALGIESPIQAIELAGESAVTVDLAVPSGPVVRAQVCGKSDGINGGLLAGYVLDARTGALLRNAEVLIQWVQLDLRRGTLQSAPHKVTGSVGEDGAYKVCAIPVDGPIVVRVSAKDFRTVEAELTLPAGGVARRDFHLVEGRVARGTASIAMRVVDDSNVAVTSGRVGIPELGREVAVENGDVVITDVPAGTWLVTVRSLGRLPQLVLLDATADPTTDTVTMVRNAPMLDTVRVVAVKARRDSQVIRDIQQRLLVADGTLIRSDNLAVVNASEASDAIRVAAGFMWKSPITVTARPFGNGQPCSSIGRPKRVVIYIDGVRMSGDDGLKWVNEMVPVKDILAIEAYPDVTSAPFLWRTNDACAVVAFWTKH